MISCHCPRQDSASILCLSGLFHSQWIIKFHLKTMQCLWIPLTFYQCMWWALPHNSAQSTWVQSQLFLDLLYYHIFRLVFSPRPLSLYMAWDTIDRTHTGAELRLNSQKSYLPICSIFKSWTYVNPAAQCFYSFSLHISANLSQSLLVCIKWTHLD